MQLCPRDTLLNTIREFYSEKVIMQSRDKLFAHIPETDGARRVRHRKSDETLKSMYDLLQQVPVENPPIFAATNLNNLPAIDLKNIDGATLVHNQDQLKQKVESLQDHLTKIESLLANGSASVSRVVRASNTNTEPSYSAARPNMPNRSYVEAVNNATNVPSSIVPNFTRRNKPRNSLL